MQNCSEDEVISLCHQLFKLERLKSALQLQFYQPRIGEEFSKSLNIDITSRHRLVFATDWFEQGANCEILKLGSQGCQKGKLKIHVQVSLEFCPDEPEVQEPESPLDDLRKTLN